MIRGNRFQIIGVVACVLLATALAELALAYVDLAPTIAKIINDSKRIAVVELADCDPSKRLITLHEVASLKGNLSSDPIRQFVASAAEGAMPLQITQWVEPGARAVAFISRNSMLVCIGHGWYAVRQSNDGIWKLAADRPDLPLAYYGSTSRLVDGIKKILAGQDAVLTAVSYGSEDVDTSIDLALNRTNLPGLVKVERFRANLKMPPMVMGASANPVYFLGHGPAAISDIPELVQKLRGSDAIVRAEAANDLGWLGRNAAEAVPPLAAILNDKVARVRFAAAAALLRISEADPRSLEVLAAGLENDDPAVKRDAAQAVGLAGIRGAPLTSRLSELLSDSDSAIRVAALEALATLGQTAAEAKQAIMALLDEPAYAVAAADALGRMGSIARPAPKQLLTMLASDQAPVRWAAVRALSQIGGPEAHPAVEFMIRELPKAGEVDAYNMLVYLALLGPEAKDAAPTIRAVKIRMNPMLRPATLWAINSDTRFPWQMDRDLEMPMPMPGGPGGPPGGLDGPGGDVPELPRFIYHAYFHELGDRLRPMVRKLAEDIINGTAGDIPLWGYEMLNCAPDDALGLLMPNLDGDDHVNCERAAVALGYMGATAAKAKPQLDAAIAKTTDEHQKRLLQWSVREVSAAE